MNYKHTLYQLAADADNAYHAALVGEYGKMSVYARYYPDPHRNPQVQACRVHKYACDWAVRRDWELTR